MDSPTQKNGWRWIKTGVALICLLPAACVAQWNGSPAYPQASQPAFTSVAAAPSLRSIPAPSLTPEALLPTTQPIATSTFKAELCSPLEGFALDALPTAVANPYRPPPIGSDQPHQGVDLAQRQAESGIALAGLPVRAALAGVIAAVIHDRFPFGNALMIETAVSALPAQWTASLALPSVPADLQVSNVSLTCPLVDNLPEMNWGETSLYVLYAHLEEDPQFRLGEAVSCGQPIGVIGASGNALNPHLHFEVRVGPSGARFPGLAHYDNRATPEEMANYCLWAVSGSFVSIDPLSLLALEP